MSNELVKGDHYTSELDYARNIGKMIVKSGKWARDWNEDTVAILVLYARDLGIHPVTALVDGFDIIQGKISMKPKMMASMIRKAGHSIVFKRNDHELCWLVGKRKDNGDTCEVKFGIEDAKRAGLAGKDNWKSWGSDMLYSRAMGRLGRMLFSDVIGGVYTDGEMDDIKAKTKKEPADEIDEILLDTVEVTDAKPVEKVEDRVLTLIDLNQALASLGEICDLLTLGKFVTYMAEEVHNTTPDHIIRSAMSSQEQLQRFQGHLAKWKDDQAPKDS